MSWRRFFRHFFYRFRTIHSSFSKESLERITQAITESEKEHDAELVFALESAISPLVALRGYSARERSIDVFSQLRVWDTEKNSGVLLYLLLADHDIEILVDRGINALTKPGDWEAICRAMEGNFREGKFEEGVKLGIFEITKILKKYFPKTTGDKNEIPNRPVIL
ncbi:MAG: hypothetical protein CK427_08200 [Leptospira sp.]|nr:MAG: hypothetical protein CK427_08200 [Leptospira sp.]